MKKRGLTDFALSGGVSERRGSFRKGGRGGGGGGDLFTGRVF